MSIGTAKPWREGIVRLRRSNCEHPGFTRQKRGRGFSYRGPRGDLLTDRETRDRIRALAIPPAWTNVWISPYANGHIQATGTDAAGRRQYIYHPHWRELKDREKFDRSLEFAQSLPAARRLITKHLRRKQPPAGLCSGAADCRRRCAADRRRTLRRGQRFLRHHHAARRTCHGAGG
ncbi:hypothetical protein [Arthrobacter sp. APC 3897]|uniref:hypothetical protein n=1 Tax=Arthrobacter sp. APC 3897 TaxID=3035204 RepID=UPI0033A1D539